jgi:predicted Zn-dependent peptidase
VARKSVLDNGIRVVTEPLAGVRSIALGVLLDVGPADEAPEQGGLAHLCEHLLFQGTTSRSALAIARLIDGAGGQLGAFVGRDYTCFAATVLDDYRYHALDLLGDVLLNSTFPAEALARQREAVACEIERGRDAPEERCEALVKGLAWAGHPLGRPLTGSPESLRRLAREDVIYFIHRHYTPDRVVVAASGNLEHEDVVAQVRDAFWRMLGEAPSRPAMPAGFRSGTVLEDAPVAQAYFVLGLPAPRFADPDRYGVHVLARLLGGGVSSRLFRRVREDLALAYHVGADYHAYRDGGMLLIAGSTAPGNLASALRATLFELWQLATGEAPADAAEVGRATTQLINLHLLSGEVTHTRASRLATQELYFGRPLPDKEVLDALAAVDEARLAALAQGPLLESLRRPALAVVAPAGRTGCGREDLAEMLAEFASLLPGSPLSIPASPAAEAAASPRPGLGSALVPA